MDEETKATAETDVEVAAMLRLREIAAAMARLDEEEGALAVARANLATERRDLLKTLHDAGWTRTRPGRTRATPKVAKRKARKAEEVAS